MSALALMPKVLLNSSSFATRPIRTAARKKAGTPVPADLFSMMVHEAASGAVIVAMPVWQPSPSR
jgi:hypothetical protein